MAYNRETFHEYPYTDPYRFDSDWLLMEVKELQEKYNDLEKRVEELEKRGN